MLLLGNAKIRKPAQRVKFAPTARRQRDGVNIRRVYRNPDGDDSAEFDPYKNADFALVEVLARIVLREYWAPGWVFEADHRQGIAWMAIPSLMGPANKFIIRIKEIVTENDLIRTARRGAGEIFERYRIPRAGFTQDDFNIAEARDPLAYMRRTRVPE